MKTYTVAILGATGAVGREMLQILEERNFPVERLILLSSARSAGTTLKFRGADIPVQEAREDTFSGADIVLGAAENEVAKHFAPAIGKAGAVFVDNSSAFRLQGDVPLVVPEVNPEDVRLHHGIIANPNCSTIITLTAVNALNRLSPIRSMTVSTYQAVSGAGAGGPLELSSELEALGKGESFVPQVFPYQIACNLIPQIGTEAEFGYTTEEMKLQNEGRKILHLPRLSVSCTCVRRAIATAPGCRLVDDLAARRYPMPLHTSGQDLVHVGRIRPDLTDPRGLCLWCCGDQLRKGAATNAVQIAQLLIQQK